MKLYFTIAFFDAVDFQKNNLLKRLERYSAKEEQKMSSSCSRLSVVLKNDSDAQEFLADAYDISLPSVGLLDLFIAAIHLPYETGKYGMESKMWHLIDKKSTLGKVIDRVEAGDWTCSKTED